MAEKKISELVSLTGANAATGDLLPIVDVDATETKKITREEFFKNIPSIDINGGTIDGTVIGGSTPAAISGTTITGTSFVSSGDMTFGDNDKAIFGAGSDLQIYHDGSNSYISDQGTGHIKILANDFRVVNAANTEQMITADQDGAVTLYNDSVAKLATTSTGVDVTGTVTADGLTVSGSDPILTFTDSDTGETAKIKTSNAGHLILDASEQNAAGAGNIYIRTQNNTLRALYNYNGDISFYEDTGTTPKFFWDASTERLGIGNAAPTTTLDVTGTVTADGLKVDGDSQFGNSGYLIYNNANPDITLRSVGGAASYGNVILDANGRYGSIQFRTGYDGSAIDNEQRMKIDTNGDISFYEDTGTTPKFFWDASAESLGIGTASPSAPLTIGYSGAEAQIQINNSGGNRMVYLGAFSANEGILRLFNSSNVETVRIPSESTAGVHTYFNAGNVGIGTSSPLARLNIQRTGTGSETALLLSRTLIATNDEQSITWRANDLAVDYASVTGTMTGATAGALILKTISSGSTPTERMRITSTGNVGIGTSSPAQLLHIASSAPDLRIEDTDGGYADFNISAGSIELRADQGNTESNSTIQMFVDNTERMRIDSSGNVGIGTSSPEASAKVDIAGNLLVDAFNNGGEGYGIFFRKGFINTDQPSITVKDHNGSSPDGLLISGYDGISFKTNTSERMRIDSSGNVLIGGTTAGTASAGNLVLVNGTAPTGNVTNGITLYAEDVSASSELKVRDEAGNVTTLSPHNFDLIPEGPSEDMAWSYYSERDGKRINVDMLKAIRILEQLSGEKLVHMV